MYLSSNKLVSIIGVTCISAPELANPKDGPKCLNLFYKYYKKKLVFTTCLSVLIV